MVMAADYPFMDVLWSMIIFFFWVIWIWIVISCQLGRVTAHLTDTFSFRAKPRFTG
jgi:hypothetical protein